jgi:hypothetical protein
VPGDTHLRSNLKEKGDLTASFSYVNTKALNLDLNYSEEPSEGRLSWNSTDGTVEYGLPGGNVVLQVGQETLMVAVNKTATDMANGEAVYITGAQGGRPTIEPAIASSGLGLAAVPVGLTTEPIGANSIGYVNTGGLVRGIDTSHLVAGGIGYVSLATPGWITTAQPSAPHFTTIIGYCVTSNASSGIFFVRSLAADRLIELSDVDHTTPTVDGQYYEWNTGNARFELQKPNAYGEIYSYNNATPVTVATAGTYYQILTYHANGAAYDTIASYTEGHIKIQRSGVYNAQVSMTVQTEGGAGAVTADVDLKKNNGTTSFNNIHAHRRLAGGGNDIGSVSMSGLVTLATDDTVEVWIANETDTFNLVVEDINLTVNQIGGN